MGYSWATGAAPDGQWRWPVGTATVPIPVAAVQVYAQAIGDHAETLVTHDDGCAVCAEAAAHLRAIASDMDSWTR
jgi:hypothetical protein